MTPSRTGRQLVFVVFGAALLLGALAATRAAESYHLLKKYTFPAAEGSTREYFDYITVDSEARRVYLSHGTEIKVIDADNGSVVGTIGGLKQTHGVAEQASLAAGLSPMARKGR